MSRAAEPWNIADVIDLEYLLTADAETDSEKLRQRDRAIYEKKIRPVPGDARSVSRSALFKAWLQARREEIRERLPGEYFLGGWHTLLLAGAVFGITLGGGVTAGLLHYKGAEPVNVAIFLGVTVGVQLLILAALLLAWLFRRAMPLPSGSHPLRWLIESLGAALQRLPGEKRERLRAALATIDRKREIYGSLAVWPLLIVTQVFAVCYNAGILVTLLAHVTVTDLEFGWQSTLDASPAQAYRLVRAISAPWRTFAPNAHPTLGQIEGSRFQYSSGLKPLATAAMTSWWPFLCYAVVCYGLLPRAVLLVFAAGKLRGTLARLNFDEHECNALFRRLTGPVVQPGPAHEGPRVLNPDEPETTAHSAPGGTCFGLLASDTGLTEAETATYMQKVYGWRLVKLLPMHIDHPGGNHAALAELRDHALALASVVVVAPAERDPIVAIARCLKEVIEAAGAKADVLLLLTGARRDGRFAPVPGERVQFWRNLMAIHHLRVGIECLSE